MNLEKFSAREIASAQIESALRLFQRHELIAVITLAGAAEQVLGELLDQGKPPFSLRSMLAILRPGRNRAKTPARGTVLEDGGVIHMDPRQEAVFLLGRAIRDYRTAAGALTPAMRKFLEEQR
jgi:hypothetical protein